jgi:subtilisin family serine protease
MTKLLRSTLILALALLVSHHDPAPIAQTETTIPLHYIHGGTPVPLVPSLQRLAVRYRQAHDVDLESAVKKAGETPVLVKPIGGEHWSHLWLSDPPGDIAALNGRMKSLVAVDGVEFVSPVFEDDGGWVAFTPDVLVRVKPQEVAAARVFLRTVAPELRIVGRNVAGLARVFRLRGDIRNGFEILSIANRLARDPRVEWAEPNAQIGGQGQLVPNDPLLDDTWGIRHLDSNGRRVIDMSGHLAWDVTTGSSSTKVLLLDDGVDRQHPDFTFVTGRDFTEDAVSQPDGSVKLSCDRHGIKVAGCIAALINNGRSAVGIAPDCIVLSARVYKSDPPTSGECPDEDWTAVADSIANAITWGKDQGVLVSNNSNGHRSSFEPQVVEDAYDDTRAHGVVHFAAAGNKNLQQIDFPAKLSSVNAVGAIDSTGAKASFSNRGNGMAFAAPGVGIWTHDFHGFGGDADGDSIRVDGTSFASPYAAGVAALLRTHKPTLNVGQVERRMECTCWDLGAEGHDENFGHGLVNAYSVLNFPLRRVSFDSTDVEANGGSGQAMISGNGRFVAFHTDASNLVDNDTNGARDIMVHDRHLGRVKRVSVNLAFQQLAGASLFPAISHNGRFVAFETDQPLHLGDINGLEDIWVVDRDADQDGIFDEYAGGAFLVYRASVDTLGSDGNGWSTNPKISADGRYVTFRSTSTDLVSGDTNNATDIFIHDTITGTTEFVSVSTSGTLANGTSFAHVISADGQHVAFESQATNLVTGDTNGVMDVFVRDLTNGTTTRVSIHSNGTQATMLCVRPSISGDGRLVAFQTDSPNLVSNDTNGAADLFVHDRDPSNNGVYDEPSDRSTARVSVTTSGGQSNAPSFAPWISANGRYVAFESNATNLVTGDNNGDTDIYIFDRQTSINRLRRVTLNENGDEANGSSFEPSLAASGRDVAFYSSATNLVANDNNSASDVFIHQCLTPFSSPVVVFQPEDQIVAPGDDATFVATSSGSPPPSYQWRKDGQDIDNATNEAHTVENANFPDAGLYDVVITNEIGSVVSAPAMLTVDATVPVAFQVFEVQVAGNGIELRWSVLDGFEVEGYNVYRATGATSALQRLNRDDLLPPDAGRYFDNDVVPSEEYRYAIGAVTSTGELLSRTRSIRIAQITTALEQNHPNPFNPETTIRYTIATRSHVSIKVYDVAGRLVRTLVDKVQSPRLDGFKIEWDGRTNPGAAAASGVYFYSLVTEDFTKTRKMVLLR